MLFSNVFKPFLESGKRFKCAFKQLLKYLKEECLTM